MGTRKVIHPQRKFNEHILAEQDARGQDTKQQLQNTAEQNQETTELRVASGYENLGTSGSDGITKLGSSVKNRRVGKAALGEMESKERSHDTKRTRRKRNHTKVRKKMKIEPSDEGCTMAKRRTVVR